MADQIPVTAPQQAKFAVKKPYSYAKNRAIVIRKDKFQRNYKQPTYGVERKINKPGCYRTFSYTPLTGRRLNTSENEMIVSKEDALKKKLEGYFGPPGQVPLQKGLPPCNAYGPRKDHLKESVAIGSTEADQVLFYREYSSPGERLYYQEAKKFIAETARTGNPQHKKFEMPPDIGQFALKYRCFMYNINHQTKHRAIKKMIALALHPFYRISHYNEPMYHPVTNTYLGCMIVEFKLGFESLKRSGKEFNLSMFLARHFDKKLVDGNIIRAVEDGDFTHAKKHLAEKFQLKLGMGSGYASGILKLRAVLKSTPESDKFVTDIEYPSYHFVKSQNIVDHVIKAFNKYIDTKKQRPKDTIFPCPPTMKFPLRVALLNVPWRWSVSHVKNFIRNLAGVDTFCVMIYHPKSNDRHVQAAMVEPANIADMNKILFLNNKGYNGSRINVVHDPYNKNLKYYVDSQGYYLAILGKMGHAKVFRNESAYQRYIQGKSSGNLGNTNVVHRNAIAVFTPIPEFFKDIPEIQDTIDRCTGEPIKNLKKQAEWLKSNPYGNFQNSVYSINSPGWKLNRKQFLTPNVDPITYAPFIDQPVHLLRTVLHYSGLKNFDFSTVMDLFEEFGKVLSVVHSLESGTGSVTFVRARDAVRCKLRIDHEANKIHSKGWKVPDEFIKLVRNHYGVDKEEQEKSLKEAYLKVEHGEEHREAPAALKDSVGQVLKCYEQLPESYCAHLCAHWGGGLEGKLP